MRMSCAASIDSARPGTPPRRREAGSCARTGTQLPGRTAASSPRAGTRTAEVTRRVFARADVSPARGDPPSSRAPRCSLALLSRAAREPKPPPLAPPRRFPRLPRPRHRIGTPIGTLVGTLPLSHDVDSPAESLLPARARPCPPPWRRRRARFSPVVVRSPRAPRPGRFYRRTARVLPSRHCRRTPRGLSRRRGRRRARRRRGARDGSLGRPAPWRA